MAEGSEAKKGWLESIAGQITVVGGIFATIFAISTGFNTCAGERAAKVAAFRQAVASEESYWKSLYDDYFSTFQRDFDERGDMRNAKRFAIAQLASHGVPDFEEFDVSDASKRAASEQLTGIKNNLLTALRTPLASGAEVSITLASQDEAVIAQADARRAESSAAGAPAPAVGVASHIRAERLLVEPCQVTGVDGHAVPGADLPLQPHVAGERDIVPECFQPGCEQGGLHPVTGGDPRRNRMPQDLHRRSPGPAVACSIS